MRASNTATEALSVAKAGGAKKLDIIIAGKSIEAGQHVPKADAAKLPELAVTGQGGQYIGVCLDLDPPFQSFSFLGPILHWVQPGLNAEGAGEATKSLSTSEVPAIASYIGPGPPPGSGPHRYLFFLYQQPADFDVKKHSLPEGQEYTLTKRIRFDIDAFVRSAKLGPIVAANFFNSN